MLECSYKWLELNYRMKRKRFISVTFTSYHQKSIKTFRKKKHNENAYRENNEQTFVAPTSIDELHLVDRRWTTVTQNYTQQWSPHEHPPTSFQQMINDHIYTGPYLQVSDQLQVVVDSESNEQTIGDIYIIIMT